MALLELSNLSVFYGKSKVVDGVSFDIEQNEVVSLIGPNGAGKTSIIDSIFNFTHWEGEIRFDGEDLQDRKASEIARMGVSYGMEEGSLFPHMSVEKNLKIGGVTERETLREHLDHVYDLFPVLEERSEQKSKTLSGGERQMLTIGKALMADPQVLIFDEPTLGLAPIVIETISEAFQELRKEKTILLVEQNVTFGFEHADRILLIESGKIVKQGTASELGDADVKKAYLGT